MLLGSLLVTSGYVTNVTVAPNRVYVAVSLIKLLPASGVFIIALAILLVRSVSVAVACPDSVDQVTESNAAALSSSSGAKSKRTICASPLKASNCLVCCVLFALTTNDFILTNYAYFSLFDLNQVLFVDNTLYLIILAIMNTQYLKGGFKMDMFPVCVQLVLVSNKRGYRVWVQSVNDIIFNDEQVHTGGPFCYICTVPKSIVFN